MPPAVVLGIDFGGTKIAIAVGDLDGNRLGEITVPAAAESGAAASLAATIVAGRGLLDRVAPGGELAGLGVSTFGIPGPDGVALAPAIDGWADVSLARELGAAFDRVPIRLVTDVKAAAQVEAERGALAGCDPAIYLNLGTGLAVAIVAGGTVLAGRHGASGEIGYNLRGLGDVGRGLDDRTPLEATVSGGALLTAAARVVPGITGAAFFGAVTEDPALAAVLDDFLTELSFHLVNLAVAVDPQRIAVGGGMVRAWDLIGPRLRAALDAAVPYPPELVIAAFPHDAPLIGALAHGVAAARGRPTGVGIVQKGIPG
ncbi:ROK family protein [Paractinoplanes globisporus]|uniref:ROK family protein n=1 Tax=Paractinoplanes globisporus TaxID=113565 RepID=A0ABW6W9P9_9ACTN|nr:ROK family protein [Actinoplanes globisporus]